jgi:CarboxypepD_reg-like domain
MKTHLYNLLFFTFFALPITYAQTIISGRVATANRANDPLAFVNVAVVGTAQGTQTDSLGNYRLVIADANATQLQFSLVGYKPETRSFKKGNTQTLNLKLTSNTQTLGEVTVKSKKDRYRNRDNPAVALIRQVIDHKDQNRKEALDFYQFEKYEKARFEQY